MHSCFPLVVIIFYTVVASLFFSPATKGNLQNQNLGKSRLLDHRNFLAFKQKFSEKNEHIIISYYEAKLFISVYKLLG